MKTSLFKSLLIIILVTFSTISVAKKEPSLMTYQQALQAIKAAEAYANKKDWKVTILVTDQNAVPVMLHRLDGAFTRSIDFATSKALVVSQTGLTSGEYAEKLKAGEIEKIEGGVTYKGGVPVYIDGQLIGTVNVSGVKDYEDEEVAIAGAKAITENFLGR